MLIRCVTAQGVFIWQIQGMQVGAADPSAWTAHQAVPLESTTAESWAMPPMTPMAPMPPLTMGNMTLGDMQMSSNPMTMRMGDMTLSMGEAKAPGSMAAPASTPEGQKFCTQCGTAVNPSDRFCGSCGHRLH
ncbi:zinc-ribbon domain-containing protein [Leptolyngbya sp. KIOST-1]|uniref:zinc-ribbon domain-containing protein n=1 Tax=Leptolyngbya sp. KIOST-1 TaxID=1229172 RepID=UPI000AEB3CE4|nr:zinc-ribbon domain-containing protein [Leptolyngbya sp. KIOST-1]